jgi:helicase required for RNAi-mediated heterochromatin assembly 1
MPDTNTPLRTDYNLSNVDILKNWPTIPGTQLDDSQMTALRRIITKKLAIVQGPPGTGKTFVSISALKTMLDNLSPEDPPIIVSAQTNHALDQLLTIIAMTDPNSHESLLRLGGRASEENKLILERTLFEVRMKENQRRASESGGVGLKGGDGTRAERQSYKNSKNAMGSVGQQILTDIQRAMDQSTSEVKTLLECGIITQDQFDSLHDDDWVYAENTNLPPGVMALWLGKEQLASPPKSASVNFGFEEEELDPEFEELQEIEAETKKMDDDDIDALRGEYHSFCEHFTGIQTPGYSDKKIRRLLQKTSNLWDISPVVRGEVYRYFRRKLKIIFREAFRQHIKDYTHCSQGLKLARWQSDTALIRKVGIKLIGCTTTGLSKYRGLLAALQPRTLLIEEAAETLEGTILAAQFESLQQLILVGDHQQLQASCNVSALLKPPFNLAISMFERLVNNGIEYTALNKQRRMITEIRDLLSTIYPNLQDHDSVLDCVKNRKPVEGMGGRNSYWFEHTWPERKDETSSKYNIDEAEMIAHFFAYLVLNGMNPSNITILTFYNGQRKVLIKELRKNPHLRSHVGAFNVFNVDSYQGEENDIILLSLVRSNNFGDVGFLENKNRAVVALSRARRGMYVFGNVINLLVRKQHRYDIWWSVTDKFVKSQPARLQYGSGLPIVCATHGTQLNIHEPYEWDCLVGGCTVKCGGELPCGHACPHLCHP